MTSDFAPGLPSKKVKHPFPEVKKPSTFEFGLHHHFSEGAAGEHFDLRLGDPATSHAHSWALKYWPKPGEARLANFQPTHRMSYMDFQGYLGSGYGKGQVNLARREHAEIVSASPEHVRFNLYPGNESEEYLLRKTDGDKWLLHNTTTTRSSGAGMKLPSSKPSYKALEPEKLKDELHADTVWQAKIDGAHVLYDFRDTGSQQKVFSYRPAERATGIIEHTHRLPDFHTMRTPKELRDTTLRGELVAMDEKGKALPPERVGGILNSGVWKSRQKQRQEGKLVPFVFDVVKWKGKDVSNAPYEEKRKYLELATAAAPWLKMPRTATTPEDKKKLYDDILHKREPSTEEGLISWKKDSPAPTKAKFRNEVDVYLRRPFMEKSTKPGRQAGMAGGFEYSLTKDGPIVGRVGTGMSHALKKDLAENFPKYEGLAARTLMQRGYVGRAPAFISFHLDQPLPEGIKVADAGWNPPPWSPEDYPEGPGYHPHSVYANPAFRKGIKARLALRNPLLALAAHEFMAEPKTAMVMFDAFQNELEKLADEVPADDAL